MKEQVKDHLGNTYSSIADMCRFYKMNPYTYRQRIKSGWSVERALTEPTDRPTDRYSCKDHLGNVFSSAIKMCEFYNISYKLYLSRIRMGWTIERALTETVRNDSICDFNGKIFKNLSEMCKYYNINKITYKNRIKMGWTQKDALTKPLGFHISDKTIKKYTRQNSLYNTPCYDHKGCKYLSRYEMCEKYGISLELFSKRSVKGWTLEEILTTPKGKRRQRQKRGTSPNSKCCYDMNGKYFSSYSAMARYYNLPPKTLMARLSSGWSLEKALTTQLTTHTIYYQGVHYNSLSALCRELGLNVNIVQSRITSGWTLEEALGNKQHISRYYYDHLGNEFTSLKSLVEKYGTTEKVYYERKYNNWPLEQILQVPAVPRYYKKFVVYNSRHQIIKNNDEYYFPCTCLNCNNRYVFTKDQLDEHYEECSKKIYKTI